MFDDMTLAGLFAASDRIADKYLSEGEKLIRDALLACEQAEIEMLLADDATVSDDEDDALEVAQQNLL